MTQGEWRWARASVVGSSHSRVGGTCQDTCLCELVSRGGAEPALIAIVADGAGSARFGGDGASIASEHLLGDIRRALDQGAQLSVLPVEVGQEWISSVKERLQNEATRRGADLSDFACTILAAVIGAHEGIFLQVGDGVMIVQGDDSPDSYSFVFWPERGEYANTTTFITAEDVLAHVRCERLPRQVNEVVLMTDGLQSLALQYQAQRVHEPLIRQLFPAVRAAPAGHARDLSDELAAWLSSESVCSRTDDDKTLILASRFLPDPT